jgi:pimeloyl-ACP methyl ester carboxylesterase
VNENTEAQGRIERLERFDFGGPPQWALVRGQSRANPALLLVQAGPGLPIIGDASAIEQRLRLEARFRVVYWDQRGTGKSFSSKDRGPIALETSVADIRAMVRSLCERLSVSQIDVVGFSFGASLALLACADDTLPVRSLTCVGPDVRLLDNERFAHRFALAEAERRGHKRALRALRAIGEPPHADASRFLERVKWVANFGGVHRRQGFGAMVRSAAARYWRSPHYSLGEMLGALRGMEATTERLLPGLQGLDLLAKPLRVAAPVAVFQGRHDKVVPPDLAIDLAAHLGVDVVWFEDSAHLPHEEEPARFRQELLRFVSGAGARSLETKTAS